MVINFFFQKRFVFSLQGSVFRTFLMSIMISMGGLLISTSIVYGLTQFQFYWERQYLTKLFAIMLVFFYNFYLKRLVFEKCFRFKCDLKQV
jgi:putative flippase GtrA